MRVPAPVLRRGLVREDLVERHVVRIDVVPCGTTNDRRARAQVADQCRDRDIDNVVSEPPAIRPSSGNDAVAEAGLDLADEHIAAEDAQPREARVVRVRRM